MLRIFTTDNHDHAITPNHFTMLAAWFHRRAYFHGFPPLWLHKNSKCSREVIKYEERVVTPFLLPCPRSVTTMLIRRIGRVKKRRPPTSRFHTPCDTTSRKV